MKILITGSAGFIGSHVARHLLERGHSVYGVDNYNDYYSPVLKRDRVDILRGYSEYNECEMDICDREDLFTLVEDSGIELICHLAAQAGVRYSLENPFAYQRSNLEGFLSILEICRRSRVERLVYASSSSVYGGNRKVPFSESDPVDEPVSLYAATKKADELMAHTYTHLYGIQTIGLRFFTVYGPWGRPDMAYWLFTEAMMKGEPIKVFNHGNMRRDFTYIGDILEGVEAGLFREGLSDYEIFNLGNCRSERLLDMIRIVSDALGVEPRMEMYPMQLGDVEVTYADIGKAREMLGYNPSTPISEGMPEFVAWYRDYMGR